MPVHKICEAKFDELVCNKAERAYTAAMDNEELLVATDFYQTDDHSAVGVVLFDPYGDTISFGWEVYRGHQCIGRGLDLADQDGALVECVRAMVCR
jgi:hypothetical protein